MKNSTMLIVWKTCCLLAAPSSFGGILTGGGGAGVMEQDALLAQNAVAAALGEIVETEGRKFRPGLVDLPSSLLLPRAEEKIQEIHVHSNADASHDHLVGH